MRKVIIGMEGCQKCKMLKQACPDVELVELSPLDILNFARAVDIKSIPFIVVIGDQDELQKVLEQKG